MLASCSPKLLARVTRDDDVITDQELVILQVQPSSSQNEESDKDQPTVPLDANCCCVVYTSGSTGDPKGVQCAGSAVLNMALGQIQCFKLCQDDVTAQFVSVGFNAILSEIFTAFLSRGTLAVLYKDERAGDEFIRIMKLLKVTVITIPASLLDRPTYTRSDFPELKKIITAGEECTTETARKWTQDQDLLFFNVYGTSETTVCVTVYEYQRDKDTEVQNSSLPIGNAIPNVYTYLLDEAMNQVPVGSIGEIYVGGKSLSLGYVGHAASKTTERFVNDPLSPGKIIYKSGDLATASTSGILTFHGRMDDQVNSMGQTVVQHQVDGCTHLTENQNTVAQIWRKVLNLSDEVMNSITPETTFTDLGGDSLKAMRVQRAIKTQLLRVITIENIMGLTLEALTKIIFEPSEQRQ